MNILNVFKKHGGIKLIKQYLKGGAFWTSLNQFIVLGRSRTALEILRLSTTLKIKNKLAKRYKKTLINFDKNFNDKIEHKSCNKIWFCWFQGLENAPDIVKECYKSLKDNLDRKIVVLTDENIKEYVDFPDYILKKYKKGIITKTHFSDLLRLELLTRYGGTWIDATVLCTRKEKDIPDFYLNSDLFLFQNLKPGRDGHATYMSNWFITAKSHNIILEATKTILYEYWRKHNIAIDYFIFHIIMSIVADYYTKEWKKIAPIDNSIPHILLLNIGNLSKAKISIAKELTPFHKLSYKNNNSIERAHKVFRYDIIKRI